MAGIHDGEGGATVDAQAGSSWQHSVDVGAARPAQSTSPLNATPSVRVVKGWKKGPYNKLQDPLPVVTLMPSSTTTSFNAPPPAGPIEVAAPGAAVGPNQAHLAAVAQSRSMRAVGSKRASLVQVLDLRSYSMARSDAAGPVPGSESTRVKADFVSEDELIALPFKPPSVWRYVYDVAAGTWELVLYILVMLLAVMLETNARYFRSGSEYDKWWVTLYKFTVVCYPAGLMVAQFMLLCEYTLRKYMYFRLLSFGIMVQYEKRKLWRSWYFVFFCCLWIILNVWAWWGLIEWWGRNGKSGPEVLSFAVFAVVNVVSFHLIIYYQRLMDAELHVLEPLQAYLMPDMVLVSENAVKKEGWRLLRALIFGYCWPGPRRYDVDWVRAQGIRITRAAHGGSPGPAQTAEDLNSEAQAKAEKTMGDEEGAYPKGGSIGGVMHPPEAEVAPKPAGSMVRSDAAAAASVASAAVVEGVQAPEIRTAGPVAEAAEHVMSPQAVGVTADATEAAAAAEKGHASGASHSASSPPSTPAAAKPAAADSLQAAGAKALHAAGTGAYAAGAATWGACRRAWVCCFRCYCACCCWGARMFSPKHYHSGLYALPMAMMATFSWHRVWPFRRDVSFIRGIFLAAFLASLMVAGGIVFGAWLAARSPPVCQWGLDACYDCNLYQEEYVQYDQVCDAGGYNITKAWVDPDYIDPNCTLGRSWFTNGMWDYNSTDSLAQRTNYAPIRGQPLLQGYLAGTMSYYAYVNGFEGLLKGFEGQYTQRFRELFTNYGFTEYDFIFIDDKAISDTQFIVAGTGRDIFLIFRGTDGITDTFITDLAGLCKSNQDFKATTTCIHDGFLSAYRTARDQVYAALIKVILGLKAARLPDGSSWYPKNTTLPQPFTMWLTGHSLGGALATLSALDLVVNQGLTIGGVYTFGSPRVGDDRFRIMYEQSGLANVTWRFVHRKDAIPQVPPKGVGNFQHVVPATMLEGGTCKAWPEEDCPSAGCGLSGADHLMPGYMANLRACLLAQAPQLPQLAASNCSIAMLPLWNGAFGNVKDP
ncbi:hypothetical protein CHLRE_07g348550v5 [Chlamydomonas reinhardtii]|uniref:Fungal lipase-type domain-containing protein n=1 Tax=Chlamydomonas reinhardtii TaxID=3055 RepID=A0A2K3DL43_CHLRE|nr:uncharacterized protein CHLRE_07g348550v5 [Chlamydomonas reinhardtii]XP_042923081.1 uncharacterized protein CHLRE_07g348550v5 [Chlamydomonas reinhardtii]PNW81255.1 hypothetical protein CHLRE_07g348550v5 [Chlamydomonas reinhardtii]PNW81256.1 hypothetical protein CHLRE_07g348550v5 [Chlamydomonas reinhardtii]